MSSSSSPAHPLTVEDVLDETERLEQAITRTLQEIDQSFSNCHMIVSTKILPQIDRYAESSREVWEQARRWTNFFEAAIAPPIPATGYRAQANRNAVNRQQAELSGSAAASNAQATTTTTQAKTGAREYSSYSGDDFNSYTNRPRISSINRDSPKYSGDDFGISTNRPRLCNINLAASRLSPDFLDGSPRDSLPATPTPLGSSRNRLHQGTHIVPPAKIQWPKDGQGNATPTRRPYDYNAGQDRGSTTPTITLKDRPMSLSSYAQTKTTANTSTRDNANSGFQEFNIDENHQDVITPPSTLQFSVPKSKVATTPRSVLAKSRVNKIQMKDGLVIPQPIFVNDDDDPEDAAFVERYVGRGSDEADIGGSKKRGREGDFLDQEDQPARGRTWASLTEQQRNKERLLKSPRKMASVQDFFAMPSSTARSRNQGQEHDDEGRPKSSSRQVESRTNQDVGDEDEVDPLLAALKTPPEIRRSIQEYKARASLLPQRPEAPAWSLPTTTTASSAAVTTTATITSAPVSSSPMVTFSSMPPPSSSRTVTVSAAAVSVSTTVIGPTVTPAPASTTGAMNPPVRTNSDNSIDSLFRQSLSSGFEATSNRRQTMATPSDLSRGPFSSRGAGSRNSVGGSAFRAALTSAPFTTPKPAGSGNSRLSMLGSALRKPLYPTSPSPASRAAASAIATAAAASNSSDATPSTAGQQQHRSPLPPSPRRTQGLARPSMPAGMAAAISSGGTSRTTSTPIVSTASMLSQKQGQAVETTPSFTPSQHNSHTGDYSGAFSTPFSRNPPPAPRLGYHSDTLMTQSSLGLNHDGFGGYESEDRTRMMMASASSNGIGGGRTGDGMSSVGGHTSATSDSGPFTEEEGDETGDGEDEDATGNIMRSPCPPGRTLFGSTTDLKSVAQATASKPFKPSSSSQPHMRF
ncbi:DASH complex subunit ask1 [Mortierella sp. 14UC]|nr:DASH complex subunit ask1 [Mortierella sp. 14UC]